MKKSKENAYSTKFKELAELKNFIGKELGLTSWMQMSQKKIDDFAETTDDKQWIHTDPEKSALYSPYKKTIAHGFFQVIRIRRGGEHDDHFTFVSSVQFFVFVKKFPTIHSRHIDIQKYNIRQGIFRIVFIGAFQIFDRFQTIISRSDMFSALSRFNDFLIDKDRWLVIIN